MPIYEYQCSHCHHHFEQLQKVSDPLPSTCPSCGGGPVSRLISQTSFALRGEGWYKDGYSKPSSTKTPAGNPAPSSSPPATPPKTETKKE